MINYYSVRTVRTMSCNNCLAVVLIALNLLMSSSAKIIEGQLVTKEDYGQQRLLLYYDSRSQWPSVYKTQKTCDEKEEVLRERKGSNQVVALYNEPRRFKHCKDFNNSADGRLWRRCSHHRKFESARERWWFIALSNCNSSLGLWLKYKLTMTNDADNGWLRHFSADEFYILHTDFVFAILYYLLLTASCFEAYILHSRSLFHATYKLYLASLLQECLGLTFLCIYYGLYAQRGVGIKALKLFGKGLEAISTLIFLLVLILLAKGFTVTRARLKSSTSAKIGIFMTLYTIIYATLFIYEQQVLYIYESWVGYGLIALRLAGWGWFVYAVVFTLIHYPGKSSFFTRLFLMYSVWFISAPVVILISRFVVPKWMREKIINAVELLIAIEAHFVFFVRTTQIAVMSKDGRSGDGTLESFSHYQYAPTRSYAQQNHTIFAVSNGSSHYANGNNNNNNTANGILPTADC